MKAYIFLVLSLFGYQVIAAQQSLDLFSISTQYGLPSLYEPPQEGEATESFLLTNLKVPIVLSDKSIWYNNLTYQYFHVEQDPNFENNIADPIRVHGFILQTGLIQQIDEDNAIQLLFAPRLMSDMQNMDSKHFQFGGIALYEHRYNPDLMLRFGALYNADLYGPLLVPLVYVDWQVSQRWYISGLFPIYSKFAYRVNDDLDAGLAHFSLITSYRLGEENYASDYIERASIDLALYARQRLRGNVFVEGRLGYALSRHYEQYAANQQVDLRLSAIGFGDDRVQLNGNFQDGLFAQLRLVYNLELDE